MNKKDIPFQSNKEPTRKNKKKLFILGLTAAMLVTVSYLLWKDFDEDLGGNQIFTAPPGSPRNIATIQKIKGNVRKRPIERFRWYVARNNRPVGINDSIVTDKDSSINLIFPEGVEIEIGETSLVTIQKKLDKVALGISSGKINFKSSKKSSNGPLLITRDHILSLSNGATDGTIDVKNSLVTIDVKSGSLNLQDGKKNHLIQKNQITQIADDGSRQGIQSDLKLELPQPDEIQTIREEEQTFKPVKFSWKSTHPLPPETNLSLEISPTPNFESVWQTIPIERKALLDEATSISIPPGIYFWRLRTSHASVSEAREFRVFKKQPLQLIEPEISETLSASRAQGEILFSWVPQEGARHYRVIIAEDPQFHRPLKSVSVDNQNRVLIDLNSIRSFRKIYWLVESYFDQIELNSNSPSRALLLEKETATPSPTLAPTLAPTPSPMPSPAPSPAPSPTPAPSRSFSSPPSKTPHPILPKIKMLAPELTINGSGNSTSNTFTGGELKQTLSLTVEWQPAPHAKNYHIISSKNKNMKPIAFEKDVKSNHFEMKGSQISSSSLYMKISAEIQDGTSISYPVAQFNIKFLPPIPMVPKKNSTLSLCDPKRTSEHRLILMTWRSTQFTQKYEIQISSQEDFSKIIQTQKTPANFLTLIDPRPMEYWWRVRSLSDVLKSGWSFPTNFLLTACPKKLKKIKAQIR